MNNRKFIILTVSVIMVLICSLTAFAQETTSSTNIDSATTEETTVQTTQESKTDVTILYEEVTLADTELAETEIEIETSDVVITENEPETDIVIDYVNTHTDIPNTGSNEVMGFSILSALCGSAFTGFATRKRKCSR